MPFAVFAVRSGLFQRHRHSCAQLARLHCVAATQHSAPSLSYPINGERYTSRVIHSPKSR